MLFGKHPLNQWWLESYRLYRCMAIGYRHYLPLIRKLAAHTDHLLTKEHIRPVGHDRGAMEDVRGCPSHHVLELLLGFRATTSERWEGPSRALVDVGGERDMGKKPSRRPNSCKKRRETLNNTQSFKEQVGFQALPKVIMEAENTCTAYSYKLLKRP